MMHIFFSCGKKEFPKYEDENLYLKHSEAEGSFKVRFSFLNSKKYSLSSSLWIKGNQFFVSVFLRNAHPQLGFRQFIHEGERCPTEEDDLNEDNKIDYFEAILASGKILVPLDGNLEHQKKGYDRFPLTNKKGIYFYSRSGSVVKLINNLHSTQNSLEKDFGSLRKNQRLDLSTRVLMIFGDQTDPLLPIACGNIQRD